MNISRIYCWANDNFILILDNVRLCFRIKFLMLFPLNWKCWNWKWWKEWTCGWVLLGIMPFFQKTVRSRWWNFALYEYIRRSGWYGWSEQNSFLGNFFCHYLDRLRQNYLSLCCQLNGCQINLWITLDKILSIVFLCFLIVHDNKDGRRKQKTWNWNDFISLKL